MAAEFVKVRFPDGRPIYPLWCRVFGHRWQRVPYTYPREWERTRSCSRCRPIEPPTCRKEWKL